MRIKLSYERYDFSDFKDESVVHLGIAEFVRIAAGELHPVRALVEGSVDVDGDIMLAVRIPDIFGTIDDVSRE